MNVNAANKQGETALHVAVKNGNTKKCLNFFKWSTKIDSLNQGLEEIVKLLTQNKANIDALTTSNSTALQYATKFGNSYSLITFNKNNYCQFLLKGKDDLVNLLASRTNIDNVDIDGRTALFTAVTNGSLCTLLHWFINWKTIKPRTLFRWKYYFLKILKVRAQHDRSNESVFELILGSTII